MDLSILTFKIQLRRNFIRRNKKSEKKRWSIFRRKIKDYLEVAQKIANYSIRKSFGENN